MDGGRKLHAKLAFVPQGFLLAGFAGVEVPCIPVVIVGNACSVKVELYHLDVEHVEVRAQYTSTDFTDLHIFKSLSLASVLCRLLLSALVYTVPKPHLAPG
jgi:hypothetical protein